MIFPVRRHALTGTVIMAVIGFCWRASAVETASVLPPLSTNPAMAAQQRGAYEVVHRYEERLNAGDTAGILDLYAADGVAEWNNKPTFATMVEKRDD